MSRGPSPSGPHIFLSCGEASGERYGAALVRALRARRSDLRLTAFGGPALAAEGVELMARSDDVAVMGFFDVLAALPRILKARRLVNHHLRDSQVDLVVPIDFPGFNLGLGARARSQGKPVYHIVAPQLWAWGSWRIGKLRKAVDRLGVLLPFEKDYFEKRGVPCDALGHPLSDDYPAIKAQRDMERRETSFVNPSAPIRIGLLPGSRRQEVLALAPLLLETLETLKAARPDRIFQAVVSVAPGVNASWLEPLARDGACELSREPLTNLLSDLDLAVVCSGTASLEASLAGVPHALVYRTSALNYFLGRMMVKVERIGLANLILGRDLVQEFVQDEANASSISSDLLHWLDTTSRRRRFREGLSELRRCLGPAGFWDRSAESILKLLPGTSGNG